MKSYFLLDVDSAIAARQALETQLPGQSEPWLLLSRRGDPIAFFHVGDELDGEPVIHIEADVSGRHFNEDAAVLDVLTRLQALLGGVIEESP